MPYDVFISYAHEDRLLLNKLTKHLSTLQRQKIISTWYDTNISPGAGWHTQLMDHLNKSQIILLLISSDFMASDFCYSIEMMRAIERNDADEARVIPIILRSTYWKDAPFAKLQALPSEAKPITKWADTDEAFLDVVKGIRRAIDDLQKQGKAPNP
jgi:TIR domain